MNLNQKQNNFLAFAENNGVTILNIEDYINKTSIMHCMCKNGHPMEGTVENLLKIGFECLECLRDSELNIEDSTPYFLSLDAATYVTGVAMFNRSGQVLGHKTISIDKRKDYFDRLEEISAEVTCLVEKFNIQCVILEDIQYQQNPVLFKKLAMLQGVLRFLIIKVLHKELVTAMADEWRSYNHIYGAKRNEQKQSAIDRAELIYGIPIPEDESEAIFLGKHGIHVFNDNRHSEEE